MAEEDRRSRDIELLKNAVDRDRKKKPAKKPGSGRGRTDSTQMLYRGKPVAGRGNGGRAPGAPGSSSRGASSNGASKGNTTDLKEALRQVTQLYNDGLITTAEYDAKRAEILDRL